MAHISFNQRYTISCMLKEGYKQVQVAKAIEKNKSVVSRELKRNSNARNNN
ncbi:MAG: helix-turn-helix domain-containing protein [Flavobacteriales bacterium]|nr:helix-turn-helix domain-containing protein [Flavobacteriales bacterium]